MSAWAFLLLLAVGSVALSARRSLWELVTTLNGQGGELDWIEQRIITLWPRRVWKSLFSRLEYFAPELEVIESHDYPHYVNAAAKLARNDALFLDIPAYLELKQAATFFSYGGTFHHAGDINQFLAASARIMRASRRIPTFGVNTSEGAFGSDIFLREMPEGFVMFDFPGRASFKRLLRTGPSQSSRAEVIELATDQALSLHRPDMTVEHRAAITHFLHYGRTYPAARYMRVRKVGQSGVIGTELVPIEDLVREVWPVVGQFEGGFHISSDPRFLPTANLSSASLNRQALSNLIGARRGARRLNYRWLGSEVE